MARHQGGTIYERGTLKATEAIAHGVEPGAAWYGAMRSESRSLSCATKPCPRTTFMGLSATGLLKGNPAWDFDLAQANVQYALAALPLLMADPSLADAPRKLWNLVHHGAPCSYNQQMHVVTALWREKRFVWQ